MSKKDIINVSVEDIVERNPSWLAYNHDVAIVDLRDIKPTDNHKDIVLRLEALSIILVLDGKIDININSNNYHFDSSVLFDIAKLHTFSNMRMSANCRGYHVILSSDFTREIMSSIKKLSVSTFISRYNYPIEMLNSAESDLLEELVLRTIKNIKREGHAFHRDLIKNDVRSFIIEVMNIISQRNNFQTSDVKHDKSKIIGKFILLLDEHCKKEHNVEFYAQKLCVDAKHLSRTIKTFSGKTAAGWISEAVLKEAKTYLQDPDMPIQQIADKLNFSDQSSFGKFFKKHCGVSPLNYRTSRKE
ncbi:MAG: helix-turn-helix domain-containing protein [Rikenellaceae bacterium]